MMRQQMSCVSALYSRKHMLALVICSRQAEHPMRGSQLASVLRCLECELHTHSGCAEGFGPSAACSKGTEEHGTSLRLSAASRDSSYMLRCCLQHLQACPHGHAAKKQQVGGTVWNEMCNLADPESCNRGCTVLSMFFLHLCRVILNTALVDTCNTVLPDCRSRNAPEKHSQCGATRTACHRCSNPGQAHRAVAQLIGCTIDGLHNRLGAMQLIHPCCHCDLLPRARRALWLCDYTCAGEAQSSFPGSG